MVAYHIIFKGRVQGVGFRYGCHRIAGGYEVRGFVKNLPDRSVEMFIQGEDHQVEACLMAIEDYFSGYIRDRIMTKQPMNPRHNRFVISY